MPALEPQGREVILDLMSDRDFRPRGIIHIGANRGYEVLAYSQTGARHVVYVEGIPEIYEDCQRRISRHNGHIAACAVCGGEDGREVRFNVASNDGQSSSMLGLGEHQRLHPEVEYTRTFECRTVRADTLVRRMGFVPADFDYLVLDVQGSELDVLTGATELLQSAHFVVCEVSDFRLYENGCTALEVIDLLRDANFEVERQWLRGPKGQRIGDIVFERHGKAAEP